MQEHAAFDGTLGYTLREKRLELGWGATQAATLYGEAVRGEPITRKAYLRMEEGYLPQSPKRRLLLAAMLGMAPAALGISEVVAQAVKAPSTSVTHSLKVKALNLKEYRGSLFTFWSQGFSDPLPALKNISQRIQTLHNNVLYGSLSEKESMKQLLCGFHMIYGSIARAQGFDKPAVEHCKRAIILAHEEGYTDLEAAARHHYGAYFFDKGEFKSAMLQFQKSIDLDAAPFLQGCTLALSGFNQACLATSPGENTKAWRLIDASEGMLDSKPEPEEVIHQVVLTPEAFHLFKARTLVASPSKKLRSPESAEEAMNEALKLTNSGTDQHKRRAAYRQLESNIVMGQIYLDREYYPIATSLAQDILDLSENFIGAKRHLPFVERIYAGLQSSSYGKDVEVAKLGMQIAKLKHIQLFHE